MTSFDPPPDLSGGYFVLKMQVGTDIHRHRVHVYPFTQHATGSNTYDYTAGPITGTGAETTVNQTVTEYMNLLRPFYGTDTTISLMSLFRRTGANTFEEEFPIPSIASVVGSGGTATSGIARAIMNIWNFRTFAGRRMRLVLVGMNGQATTTPQSVNVSGSGTASAYVAYVCGSASGVCAHDGTKPVPPANLTTPYNRRLRRHYGMA